MCSAEHNPIKQSLVISGGQLDGGRPYAPPALGKKEEDRLHPDTLRMIEVRSMTTAVFLAIDSRTQTDSIER